MASFLAVFRKPVDIELSPHFPVITIFNENNQCVEENTHDDAIINASC